MDRDESVQQYLADLDNMHKERSKSLQQTRIYLNIQVVLEVPGEKELRAVAEKLSEAGIQVFQQLFEAMAIWLIHAVPSSYVIPQHNLWVEQPENFPTCLATKPCPKEVEVWLVL